MKVEELLALPGEQLDRAAWRYLLGHLAPEHWAEHRSALLRHVDGLIRRGFARDAHDMLPAPADPPDLRIEQLRAHTLLNMGAAGSARTLLEALPGSARDDSETLGFLGRAEKELARKAGSDAAMRMHLERALGHYQAAFDATGAPYPGINAASLSARLGRLESARQLAASVEAVCAKSPDDYWSSATLGEARLVLGRTDDALEAYRRFVEASRNDSAALASAQRQAAEVLTDLSGDAAVLEGVFPTRRIAVFTGHRADVPGQSPARLPAELLPGVREALIAHLEQQNISVGFSAAADGADLLFLEALAAVGAETHIVLPAEVEAFKSFSVSESGDWPARFDQAIERATSITIASEAADLDDPESIVYGNLVMLGLARLRQRELAGTLSLVAVWDGATGRTGGTADTLSRSAHLGIPLTVITPQGALRHDTSVPGRVAGRGKRRTMGLVLADIAGYGRYTDREIEYYYDELLVEIDDLCRRSGPAPVARETFGDAFYFVTEQVEHAAELALRLQSYACQRTLPGWQEPISMRIALHAGPLLPRHNPVTGKPAFAGRHATKVARVEPIADDNQILTTQQFAAMLSLYAPQSYELTYAGDRMLSKAYGTERLYVLDRAHE